MKRNAIIIVGIFKYNLDILNQIKRCYDLDDKINDIYVYNNNSLIDNKKIQKYFDENNINYISINSRQYTKDSHNMYRNNNKQKNIQDNYSKFKQLCIDNKLLNNNNLSRHVPFKTEKWFSHNTISSPQQYEQIFLALNEIKKYELENDFEYDFIMKIRLDFFLKHDKFGPLHYFNDTNDVLLKSYSNLKKFYDKIDENDDYHITERRINNYLYWRTTKFLGGQYILNSESYDKIKNDLNSRDTFNKIIKDKFVISINDACFFSSGKNFKVFVKLLYENYGEFYHENANFWWTAECQFQLSILKSDLYYFDYLQNNNYYKGREMWVNDYHGIEKYNHNEMRTG